MNRFAALGRRTLSTDAAFARHRPVMNLFDKRPTVSAGCFVAPNASVIGKVLLFDRVSIMYGAVIRGDLAKVKIGSLSNVQDRVVIKTVASLDSGFPSDVSIGDKVTICPGAILTSCTVGSNSLVGAGAIIQTGCDIGPECVVAAGSVVPADTVIPRGQFWAGNPAKYVRDTDEVELGAFDKLAEAHYMVAEQHIDEILPYGTVYQEAEKL